MEDANQMHTEYSRIPEEYFVFREKGTQCVFLLCSLSGQKFSSEAF